MLALESQAMRGQGDVVPMAVATGHDESSTGVGRPSLAALGGQRDHVVAGEALVQARKSKKLPPVYKSAGRATNLDGDSFARQPDNSGRGAAYHRGVGYVSPRKPAKKTKAARPRTSATPNSSRVMDTDLQSYRFNERPLAASSTTAVVAAKPDPKLVFGAVYEHHDRNGRPVCVGSTSKVPEDAYALDRRHHRSVAELLGEKRGGSRLVWAGVGWANNGVGDGEMTAMREAVAGDRSRRQEIEMLRGAKPYSAHSALLADTAADPGRSFRQHTGGRPRTGR